MNIRDLLTTTATCAIVMGPALGMAQEGGFTLEEGPVKKPEPIFASEVEAGVGFNSEDSFKFGEYTGLTDSEPFVILNFDVLNRGAWDSGDTGYYRIRGERLGLDSRYAEAEYGNQGHYSLGLRYREIPHNLIEGARTPYRGAGGTNLTLPAGWTPAASTFEFPNLGASLNNINIRNERKQLTGLASYLPSDKWTLDFSVGHEDRSGTKPGYAAFATNGGNPSIVALPRPVEWTTNDIEATLGYAGDESQFELEYHGSFFNNDNSELLFQNPYSQEFSGAPWAAGAGYPASGGLGLPPDNASHQLSFSGGMTLGEASRLGGQISYSKLTQDEQFLPYSFNPALSVNQGLPRQSLDGDLEILVADLSYTTRLATRTNLRAHARYEDQDNSTPQDVFVRIAGDAQNQPSGIDNSNARINLPYSFEKLQLDAEIEHRLTTKTKVGVEYEFEQISRNFSEVEETNEHTVGGKIRHRFSNTTNGRLVYRHAERDFSGDYVDNAPFFAGHTIDFLSTEAPEDQFETHPEIRKYNFADRSLDELKASLMIASTPETSWSLHGSVLNEDFSNTSLGLTERQMWRAAVDWNHTLREDILLRAYYSFEQFDDKLNGHGFRAGQSLIDPTQRWTRDGRDRIHSLGTGFVWTAIREKLDVDFDYSFSLAETDFSFTSGGAFDPVLDAPTLSSDRHTVEITANWRLAENRKLRVGYIFEYFDADDFALDGVGVNSIDRQLTFGVGAPDYTAHVIGVSYVANW